LKKILSFSLYGKNNKYIEKFIYNTPAYLEYFFDYEIVLYADIEIHDRIHKHCIENGIRLVLKERLGESDGMFWRYLPIIEQMGDLCLVRDVDYRPCRYELDLVNSFIDSSFEFHIIRAHHDHRMPIMGGLFGIKKTLYKQFKNGYREWSKFNVFENVVYNDDQLFLGNYVYKMVWNKAMIHTSNVAFLFEKYNVIGTDVNFIIGGDENHDTNKEKHQIFTVFAPVCFLRYLKFRAMKYLKIVSFQK
jgi:hypothetical protein